MMYMPHHSSGKSRHAAPHVVHRAVVKTNRFSCPVTSDLKSSHCHTTALQDGCKVWRGGLQPLQVTVGLNLTELDNLLRSPLHLCCDLRGFPRMQDKSIDVYGRDDEEAMKQAADLENM